MTFPLILISRIVNRPGIWRYMDSFIRVRSLFWLFPYRDVVFFANLLTSAEITFAAAMDLEDRVRAQPL